MEINKEQWVSLHQNKRYRPKYPSEVVVQFIFRNFERNGKAKILDLGCGAGRHVFFMANENIVPYGVDFSEEGIEYTKSILRECGRQEYIDNIQVSSLTKLPYKDNFFNGIICYGVLYYLDNHGISKAIQEMYRVLKPGGKLLLVVRSIEDYRYNRQYEIENEKNTIIICEQDEQKCAHSENGMQMHFFEQEELKKYFSMFENLTIDYIKESHNNQKFCDCNYVLIGEK